MIISQKTFIAYFVGLVLTMLLVGASTFVVRGTEQAIVVRFGKIMRTVTTDTGLFFKIPMIEYVRKYDRRIVALELPITEVRSADNEMVSVSSTALWKTGNPARFYRNVDSEEEGTVLLEQALGSAIRHVVSELPIQDLVARDLGRTDCDEGSGSKDGHCLARVDVLDEELVSEAYRYGVELVDFRITRIGYADDVRQEVVSRMIADRRSDSVRLRSEGRKESDVIGGQTALLVDRILDVAKREADEIVLAANREALTMQASSYADDRDFYSFYERLRSYGDTIDANTTLMIGADSEFYELLQSANGIDPKRPKGSTVPTSGSDVVESDGDSLVRESLLGALRRDDGAER